MTTRKFAPFADGPVRPKEVISLGFFRTGSQSLKEALTILGYRDVFHTSAMVTAVDKWPGLDYCSDDNIPNIPSYTGRTWSRDDFDKYVGACEALTDVTPFAEPLLNAYPEAKVILVYRDFDSWVTSFLCTLVMPSSKGLLAQLSGNIFEPLLGIRISQALWKTYLGIIGVSDLRKVRDKRILREGYERHYRNVRRMVPKDRLLELNLNDLDWEPLCEFLGKDVPKDTPFPRLNESKVFQNAFAELHRGAAMGVLIKYILPAGAVFAGVAFGVRAYAFR